MAQPAEHHTLPTPYTGWNPWLTGRRTLIAIAALGILYGVIVTLPTPLGLSWQGQRVLGVAAIAIGLWCTEVLPTGVTSMLVLLLLVSVRRCAWLSRSPCRVC